MNLRTDRGEFLAAMAIALFGAWVAYVASGYPYGSLLRPGSGFAPFWIGILIIALGIVLPLEGHVNVSEVPFRWPVLLAVSAGILAFGLLVERAGLVPATIALVLISGFADRRNRLTALVAIAAFMSVAGTVVFIWTLGVPVAPFVYP